MPQKNLKLFLLPFFVIHVLQSQKWNGVIYFLNLFSSVVLPWSEQTGVREFLL